MIRWGVIRWWWWRKVMRWHDEMRWFGDKVWGLRFEDGERAWCVLRLRLPGTDWHRRDLPRGWPGVCAASRTFAKTAVAAQPNTNACFRPATDAYNPTPPLAHTAAFTLKHTTQPVSCSLVARPPRASSRNCATGLFHTVLVVRTV